MSIEDSKIKRKRKRRGSAETVASAPKEVVVVVDDAEVGRIAKLINGELGEKLAREVVEGVATWHAEGNWKKQVKSVVANVRDPSNPDFRAQILSGELSPKNLANLPVTSMASVRLKRERKVLEQRAMLGRLTDEQYRAAIGQEVGDGIEECPKCGSRKTDFVIVPTSTEKDSIQNFSCSSCGNHWRVD